MRKRRLCCRSVSVRLSVCPSVRPSVTLVHCIQKAKDIVKLLSRSGSPIILVFLSIAPIHNSKGNPFTWGCQIQGVWKILRFSTEIAFYLGKSTTER